MSQAFYSAMSRFAGAVCAITTLKENEPAGIIATAVCSLSADPPSILVCVNKNASAHDSIIEHGHFCVNLLSQNQCDVLEQFNNAKGSHRFDLPRWDLQGHAPVLKDAPVNLICEVDAKHDGYSHTIIVGKVTEVILDEQSSVACLLWRDRSLCRAVDLTAMKDHA